jgi:hypothetical protein
MTLIKVAKKNINGDWVEGMKIWGQQNCISSIKMGLRKKEDVNQGSQKALMLIGLKG